jgi:hypothetical protein
VLPTPQVPWQVGDGWAGFVPAAFTTRPNVVVPLGATAPFQLALRTVTTEPDWLSVPFQMLPIV